MTDIPQSIAQYFTKADIDAAFPEPAPKGGPREAPHVRVVLSSEGIPCAVLRGENGLQTQIPLYDMDILVGILEGQIAGKIALGLDGSPTEMQNLHNAKHRMFPNDKCPFCRADKAARDAEDTREEARAIKARPVRRYQADGVVVTHIPLGTSSLKEKKDPNSRKPANRFDIMPLHLTREEAAKWKNEKKEYEALQERKRLGKLGITKKRAEDLGL